VEALARRTSHGVDIAGFFALAVISPGMSALRDALGELPDAVFADVLESDDAYLLVVDLPGVTAETVDASVEGNKLRIEARRAKDVPPEFDYVEEERALFLDIELPLPRDVTGAEAAGTVERGVLEVELPKAEDTPETPIPIDG
jgi:HSP20 family protein